MRRKEGEMLVDGSEKEQKTRGENSLISKFSIGISLEIAVVWGTGNPHSGAKVVQKYNDGKELEFLIL